MSKLVLAGLSVAAFLYAVYLLLMRKRLPNPKAAHSWRRRFTLATLLCAGFLLSLTGCRPKTAVCYMQVMPNGSKSASSPDKEKQTKPADVLKTLRAVWLTLDPARGEEFRTALDAAVGNRTITRDTAEILHLAFRELAIDQMSSKALIVCYSSSFAGWRKEPVCKNALQQLTLLRKAMNEDKLDKYAVKKAEAVLARDLTMLERLSSLSNLDEDMDLTAGLHELEALSEKYKNEELKANATTTAAAWWILYFESMVTIPKQEYQIRCYFPRYNKDQSFITPEREAQRRALLEKAEAAGTLAPEVAARVRDTFLWHHTPGDET